MRKRPQARFEELLLTGHRVKYNQFALDQAALNRNPSVMEQMKEMRGDVIGIHDDYGIRADVRWSHNYVTAEDCRDLTIIKGNES